MKTPRAILMEDVALVAAAYRVTVDDIMTSHQWQPTRARHAAMWLVWWTTGWSTSRVGRFFDRDHVTVMYGVGRHMCEIGMPHRFSAFYLRCRHHNRRYMSRRRNDRRGKVAA